MQQRIDPDVIGIQAVGEISLYNEALGTVSTLYLYDRVKDRDRGVPKRAWE